MWPPAARPSLLPQSRGLGRRFLICALIWLLLGVNVNGKGLMAAEDSAKFSTRQIEILPGAGQPPIKFLVELAITADQQQSGLMFRHYLASNHGMLFVFETQAPRQFWMKNTQIPLDMLFFDDRGDLVNIIHNATPFSLTPRLSDGPARYVLEINGGMAVDLGIGKDAKLHLPPFTDPIPSPQQP